MGYRGVLYTPTTVKHPIHRFIIHPQNLSLGWKIYLASCEKAGCKGFRGACLRSHRPRRSPKAHHPAAAQLFPPPPSAPASALANSAGHRFAPGAPV